MVIHSNILAWEIPWREEPGRLQSLGLQKFRHNLVAKQQQQCIYTYTIQIYVCIYDYYSVIRTGNPSTCNTMDRS